MMVPARLRLSVGGEGGMVAPLVVLVGEAAKLVGHARDLARMGFVVLLAPTQELAREWLARSIPDPDRSQERAPLALGALSIDRSTHQVRCRGRVLPLTEQEIQFLAALAEDPGRVLSFAQLVNRGGVPYYGDPSPVRAAVHRLRRKLVRGGADVNVVAVRGVGFRLELTGRT